MILETLLPPLLFSFIFTVLLTFVLLPLIKRIGLVDDPKKHKHPAILHTKIIPRGGGLPLFGGILLASLIFIPLTPITGAIFFSAFLTLVVGIIDDKFNAISKDVSPYLRFITNIICAAIIVGAGVTIPFITNPLGGIINLSQITLPLLSISLGDIIAGVWIVWVMTMLNWSKGVDGQMPGIVAISALVIGILSMRFPFLDATSIIDARLSFIIAGAALGFLLFNFYPARIFPGYGATSMYLLLAVVSIFSSAKLATAILVMGVPTVDAVFTIFRRILEGRSPFWGDKKHLHHLLLRLGYTQRQIALFYWIISAIVGTIALTVHSESKPFALLLLVALAGGGLLFLHLLMRNEKDSP
jgi:UDP-GlcNAc:undecaprenyl-phosphate GlcNAc-1-phosphate transferase